jgi:hypothetical protein
MSLAMLFPYAIEIVGSILAVCVEQETKSLTHTPKPPLTS